MYCVRMCGDSGQVLHQTVDRSVLRHAVEDWARVQSHAVSEKQSEYKCGIKAGLGVTLSE